MKLLVLSLGFILQILLGQARILQIPQSPNNNRIRLTDVAVNNQGTEEAFTVPGPVDAVVSFGGDSGNAINPSGGSSTEPPVRGLKCGSTVQMYPGNSAQVFSTNFGLANYYNNEVCTWKFEANQCTLSAHCPCVDIPRSWECLGDYLKIRTDYILENQRFCGGNRPGQAIYSDTDFLSVRFRSDAKITASGFTCFIYCEGPGVTMSKPSNVVCPNSTLSTGWAPLFSMAFHTLPETPSDS